MLAALSCGVGIVSRRVVSVAIGKAVIATGATALVVGLAVIATTALGWSPFGVWKAGLVSVVLLGAALVALPFGLAVSLGRSSRGSSTG